MPNVYPVTSVVIPYYTSQKNENKFAMVQEKDSRLWCQPGGGVNFFDNNYLSAAAREVEEETGLSVVINGFIGIYSYTSANGNRIHSVVLTGKSESGSLKTQDTDIHAVDCFSLSEIRQMDRQGKLRSGRHNVAPLEEYIRGNVSDIKQIFKST
jgi:8-oxo-dGTP pyrophosphatase MutT (NUDIX family)